MVKDTMGDRVFNRVNIALLVLISCAVIYPVYFVVIASFSDPTMINSGQVLLWPKGFTVDGYERIFAYTPVWRGYLNTIFYTVVGTLLNLALTFPCAFSLARKSLPGRGLFMFIFLFTMFFSGGLIPLYLQVKAYSLLDTVWVLILLGCVNVYNLVVIRTFFQSSIPYELVEASKIDGCTDFTLLVRIFLPLSKPIIAVMALFYGIGHWNDYFNSLVFQSTQDIYPLQMVLREILLVNQMNMELLQRGVTYNMEELMKLAQIAETMKYGLIIVAYVPIMIVYPFLQKHFTKGVMIGSLKG